MPKSLVIEIIWGNLYPIKKPLEGLIPNWELDRKKKGPYRQARDFDDKRRPVRDIDFTDHGRRDHPNPHQHRYKDNPTGGTKTRSKTPEPLK